MKSILILTIAAVMLAGCGSQQDKAPLDQTQLFELKQYLVANQYPPVEYVISKFADHDVVFLGEFHRITDHSLLVQQLVPRLYENGIFTLATEFAVKAEQALIDSLLNGSIYDENLARHIQMTQYSLWPWQEYLDIYKAAWELNRSLPDTARPFRILGINCDLDWTPVKTKEDFQKPEIRQQVWKGCSEIPTPSRLTRLCWNRVCAGRRLGAKKQVYSRTSRLSWLAKACRHRRCSVAAAPATL